ncbi:MAG: proline--tRNA ligase [Candidatus Bathyarchaeia archaeon]|jgi:prolyl-tRNA synthetase
MPKPARTSEKAIPKEKWSRHFGKWFRNVLIEGKILDYRYPIKGCAVWLPYGFRIRENVFCVIRNQLDSTGHSEALFPLLIPEASLQKEAEHVEGFEAQVFWVTKGGQRQLKQHLALRPTSETVIGPMEHLWIRSRADLPLKLYQIVTVFRFETKATRPILRMREFDFKEAHTAHATEEEAEAEVREEIDNYRKIFDALCVAYCVSRRPEWDKFAGAKYSTAFDMICPDGRTLQIGTVHHLGQHFSKAFDVSYETKDGGREYVWQTCAGISGRGIASVLVMHGDDHGVILPPRIAPIQVIVIPIPYKGKAELVNKECLEAAQGLRKKGFRVEVDIREGITPGSKYFEWELRGVPIRVEIGPRDIEKGEATVVRRDTLEKQTCRRSDLAEFLTKIAERITEDVRQRAWQWTRQHVHSTDKLEEAKRLLEKHTGIVEVRWCGKTECGHRLEEVTSARVLGTPEDTEQKVDGKCIICGEKAKSIVRAAIAY